MSLRCVTIVPPSCENFDLALGIQQNSREKETGQF